jgi:hypothetical protein
MNRKLRLSLLLVVFILLIASLVYLSSYKKLGISPISAPISDEDLANGNYVVYQFEGSQVESGVEVVSNNTAIVNLDLLNLGNYSGIVRSSSENKQFSFQIGNNVILIPEGESRKVDINNDGRYDILVTPQEIVNGEVRFILKSIDENIGFFQDINLKVESSVDQLQSSIRKQAWLIFAIVVALAAYVLYVIMASHILPKMHVEKIMAREDPLKIIRYMLDEIKKSQSDKFKVSRLTSRLGHFYDYLPTEVQEKALKQIKGIERYIN